MIINGDALTVLKRMDSESVHMAVTSSPYYGLRQYNTPPQIWDGDPNCQHEWGTVHPPGYRSSDTKPGPLQSEGNTNRQNLKSDVCIRCGAWRGELGSEPTPEMFVRHITTICHELKRVIRSDGTFFYNIGDSYFGDSPVRKSVAEQFDPNCQSVLKRSDGGTRRSAARQGDLKPKDLIGIPWMVAFSLRADGAASPQTMYTVEKIRSALLDDYDTWNDVPKNTKRTIEDLDEEWMKAQKGGWYLRADLPWIKRNALPSSVTDRPCSSIEHVFLFSKSKKYFYDHVATMQPSSESYNKDKRPRGKMRQTVNANSKYPDEGQFKKQDGTGNPTTTGFNARYKASQEEWNGKAIACDANSMSRRLALNTKAIREETGVHDGCFGQLRFMRDSDFFFKTWQGLLHNEDGEPMALVVNPRGYKGAHFACFPVALCTPLILAGTSDHGVCPHCGAPWVRTISKPTPPNDVFTNTKNPDDDFVRGSRKDGVFIGTGQKLQDWRNENPLQTTGWSPSCSCPNNVPIPAIVLDPFGGSSATGVACKLHNRNYIGIELNPEYCKLGEQRVRDGK